MSTLPILIPTSDYSELALWVGPTDNVHRLPETTDPNTLFLCVKVSCAESEIAILDRAGVSALIAILIRVREELPE